MLRFSVSVKQPGSTREHRPCNEAVLKTADADKICSQLIAVGDVAFNEPITKYVPEIAAYAAKNAASLQISDIDVYDWEALTIGALASQLSGLPRDFSFGPVFEAALQEEGLPQSPPTDISYCGNPLQAETPCNRSGTIIFPACA
jgi:hypothetical protein